MRLQNKVAIVTGGGSGLGRADALRLAEEGAKVVVTDIDPEAGQATAQACGGLFVTQDVGDERTWPELIASTVETYGGLHVLVNNAGIAIVADIEQLGPEHEVAPAAGPLLMIGLSTCTGVDGDFNRALPLVDLFQAAAPSRRS